jgi:hypothetical protein
MTAIRRLTPASGLGAITGFHGFNVDAAGNLNYTFADNGDQKLQDGNESDNYVMYEAATSDFRYAINDAGELVITFTTAS